jgi:UDP-N-acetylmuramate--alanine ligase
VVTNIDPEHMDHYRDLDDLKETFLTFVNKVPFYGASILCLDCENIQSLLPRVEKRHITYGTTPQADYFVQEIKASAQSTTFTPVRRGEVLPPITLKMIGRHNVLNALAALAVADELEVPHSVCRQALASFDGVQRRFTIRGEAAGITVVDDYGHHPTEIRATLGGAREAYNRRIIAVFQPHRYSRCQHLHDQFATAFYDADVVLVTPVYAAGEQPIVGISGESLSREIRSHGHRDVTYCPPPTGDTGSGDSDLVSILEQQVKEGDLVITLGAGDVWKVGAELLERLQSRRP